MKLNRLEKEYLIKILEGKSKKDITEDLTIFSTAAYMLQAIEKKPQWEIENLIEKTNAIEEILKKTSAEERKMAKSILKKVKSRRNQNDKL